MNEFKSEFSEGQLSNEDAFWVMYYFLKEHYDVSGGTFDVSDILSASTPVPFEGEENKGRPMTPVDGGMVDYWEFAIEKFKKKGMPDRLKLTK